MPIAYYGSKISPHMTRTPEGYLICHDVPINRIGIYKYLGYEIGRDGADSEHEFDVLRQPMEVFSKEAMASFEGKPITDGHPPDDVTPDNIQAFGKGHAQNIRSVDGYTIADLYITDPQLIDDIQSGKREISCGYNYVLTPNKNGTFEQKSIRGNHIAVVDKGRAGNRVAIKDSSPERGKKMNETKSSFWGRLMKTAARDESTTPEDMEKLASMHNEEKPAEAKPVEAKPGEAKDEPPAMGTDQKLDKIIELLMSALYEDEPEEGPHDELEELAGGETHDEEKPETTEESEESVTVSPEEMEKSAVDSARDVARSVQKILKQSIKDPVAYKQAAKDAAAEIRNVYGIKPNNSGYAKVAKIAATAAKDTAQKFMDRRIPQEKIIEEQQNAYDALNPHKKQEVK